MLSKIRMSKWTRMSSWESMWCTDHTEHNWKKETNAWNTHSLTVPWQFPEKCIVRENSPFDPEAFIHLEQGPQEYCHAVQTRNENISSRSALVSHRILTPWRFLPFGWSCTHTTLTCHFPTAHRQKKRDDRHIMEFNKCKFKVINLVQNNPMRWHWLTAGVSSVSPQQWKGTACWYQHTCSW